MTKVFKSKRRLKIKIKKILLLLLISFFSAFLLSKIKIFKNSKFIDLLKYTSTNTLKNNSINLKGTYLLNIGLNTFDNIKFDKTVYKEVNKKKNKGKKIIYVYNTHQTEEYKTIENYNLTPTVYTAAYILKDMLKEYNIDVVVEDKNMVNELRNRKLNYNDSYDISREWLESLNNEYDLYIDLHRDSIKYEYSNILVDEKDYAKIMFVVGLNHDYKNNMIVVDKLINEIEKINKSISRGKFLRKSSKFNQDYNPNCILIELGGPESTYESLINSLEVLSSAINNYFGG